jgi:predicted metal-binding membrane protein
MKIAFVAPAAAGHLNPMTTLARQMMWVVMMVAMMIPAASPVILRKSMRG